MKFLVRLTSFIQKELAEVVRQPKLILTLIFGPFLIMLLFGIGYNNIETPMRTLFVASQDSPLALELQKNQDLMSNAVINLGVTDDIEYMKSLLARNQIDLGLVLPEDAYNTVKSNQQAVFTVYHNQIDPMRVSYVNYLSSLYVDEINRYVVSSVAEQGQVSATNVNLQLDGAISNARLTREALQRGDVDAANNSRAATRRNLSALELSVGASMGLLSGVNQNFGGGETQDDSALSLLHAATSNEQLSADYEKDKTDYNEEITGLTQVENDLVELRTQLAEFTSISPSVLTRPFISQTASINPVEIQSMDFFVPGVVVLLLQHIMITLAALSIVRERRAGTMELFRVSPIKSGEILFGKYLSYTLIGVFIMAVLGLLLRFGLKAPMLGAWTDALWVVLALTFASLGIGFFISLISSTESQAVQFSMIALLFSVFFSGFFLDLRYLMVPVKYISYAIPATYGTQLLQNIMLRGQPMFLWTVLSLAGIGLLMFIISWFMLQRRMKRE